MNQYDVVIIGGGHNGLVCASYLAGGGLKVRVLERKNIVGGAAVTQEFHPGFRNSVASYTVSLLNPKVIKDLNLHAHGLKIVERPFSNFLPLPDGQYLKTGATLAETQTEFARFSKTDAEKLPAYYEMLDGVADILRKMLLETPPNVGGGITDILRGIKVGNRMRNLSMEGRRDVLDIFTKSAGDLLDSWFETDAIKAVFGFDSIVGTFSGPYTPCSAYILLHHVFGEVNGKRGQWGHAIGGMGAITQAMAKEAIKRGVEITTDAAVSQVIVKNGKTTGIVLENGEEISVACVASNLNPKLLYTSLIDENDLEPEFYNRIKNWKGGSATFRMNVAMSELPDFTCLPGKHEQPHHRSGIIIAPTMKYMERAYMDASLYGWAKKPIVEVVVSSAMDPTLAPEGQHVASLFCQHFNPNLPDGRSWDECKETAADLIIDTVDEHAPNFKQSIFGRQVISPLDLERDFSLVDGDIMHGSLTLDQLYSARPMLGYGDYRGPIKGLYMCGSGTHPGGGVTGIPGHNAAREILRDYGSSKVK